MAVTPIRQILADNQVTLSDVARATGMKKARLSNYVNGRRRIPLDQAKAVAAFLGVPVEEIEFRDPVPAPGSSPAAVPDQQAG